MVENDKLEQITEIVVDQRLVNFGDMLASFGFNIHLITLPEFHVTAFNMHKLSSEFVDNGINGYLCEIKNVDDLTEKMEMILNLSEEDRIVMGQAGRKKMLLEFLLLFFLFLIDFNPKQSDWLKKCESLRFVVSELVVGSKRIYIKSIF